MKSKILMGAVCAALVGTVSAAMADQHSTSSQFNNVYVGVNLGYVTAPWRDTIGDDKSGKASFGEWSNGNGGFGFGAYVGYMLQPHLGLEAGWIRVPTVKVQVTVTNVPKHPESVIKDNAFYVATKFTHQIGMQNTNLFAKAGIGIQHLNVANGGGYINDADTFGFYGALGLDYAVTSNIHVDGSVSYLTGYAKHSVHKFTTNLFYYSVSLGYHF